MAIGYRNALGWSAVALSTIAACFWTFWGIIENFHEGWYASSLVTNLAMMIEQYLSMMILFVGAAILGICFPRLGGAIHVAAGVWCGWFFRAANPFMLIGFMVVPLCYLGFSYWLGRPTPRRLAIVAVIVLPLTTLVICGAEPAWRIAGRFDDGNRAARHIEGNGINLIWAPEGPGWPRDGVTWDEAQRRCQFLSEDGKVLTETAQNIWRLPTVEEAVRSMQRHGQNCGGLWDFAKHTASYQTLPDKESPLWDVHSRVIYWWTATEVDDLGAYIIAYDGKTWPRPKQYKAGYLGFRAVKRAL